MTWHLVIGFIVGVSIAPVLAWRISRRLVVRLGNNATSDATARRLEKAREAHDFNRDSEPVPNAGPAVDQSNLFPTHPGRMTLAHLAEKSIERC